MSLNCLGCENQQQERFLLTAFMYESFPLDSETFTVPREGGGERHLLCVRMIKTIITSSTHRA